MPMYTRILVFGRAVRSLLRLGAVLIVVFSGVSRSQAAPPKESVIVDGQAVHPTRILARRKHQTTPKAVGQSVQSLNNDAVVTHTYGIVPELVIIETGPTIEARSARPNREAQAKVLLERIEALKASGLFEYVEPDRYLEMMSVPRDPEFRNGSLWGLRNTVGLRGVDVGAEDAWRLTQGSSNVVVAVIDSGIEVQHPDLVANLWRNPREIPGNQIDDDGNGYVDDMHGIDLVASTKGVALSKDENGHGTHVSGTIAATANNIGVVGLAYGCKLMGIRTHDENGQGGSVSSLIKGLEYALVNGARVINASFRVPYYSQAGFDAFSAVGDAGVIVVCAAGNDAQNADLVPLYPANYRLGNIISVASVNLSGELSEFSNYGLDSVDLGAPGEDIQSTWMGGTYAVISGTSMAAPHVAAVAALVISRYPNIGIHELRQRLIQSTVPIPSLAGKVKSGGIINAYRALALNPDGYPEFTLRPSKGHFVAGRITTVEVLASDVTPLPSGGMELLVAASSPVILKDDGLPPDRLAADGVYAGTVTPQAFGNQQATLRLQHRGRRWERQISVLVEKPAENDYFSNRLSLVPDASEIDGSTFGASVESFEPELQGRSGAATVWYRFTAATSGSNIVIVKGVNFEPSLRIYSGTAISSGLKVWTNEVVSNARGIAAVFAVNPGVQLAISVSSDQGIQGTFTVLLANYSTPHRPANDSRLKSDNLPLTRSFQVKADNTFATKELGEPLHASSPGGHSLWWRYDPSEDGTLEINTFGSDFDTVLAAYSVGRTVALVSNDDYKGSDAVSRSSSLVRVPVSKGIPIEIAVDGWDKASGSVVLNGKLSSYFNDSYNYPRRLDSGMATIGSNKGAKKEASEIYHAGNRGGASVWYEWKAPVGGAATVTLKSFNLPAFNPYFAIYVGLEKIQTVNDWDTLKLVANSKDGIASFEAMAGQSYRIAVDGRYYRSCSFWVFCTDEVEQGEFSISLNQQSELGLLVKTGYEMNLDAELISIGEGFSAKSLTGYVGRDSAISSNYSRLLSSTGKSVFHGYTNTAELGGGRLQLNCKFSHSGGSGTNLGWGLGFLVYPVRYSADADDITADARMLLFGFNQNGTEAGLGVGTLGGEYTSIEAPGLIVKPKQIHELNLEIDLAAQSFKVKLDGGAAVQIPLSLFGRINIAQGPFIISGESQIPYPTLLLDDLEVRVLPRGLGLPNTAPVFAGLKPVDVEEEKLFQTQLQVTDSDIPAQQLTVRLLTGPTGLVVSSQGIVSWTPTEAQGPGTYSVTVEVSDGVLSSTSQFNVSVLEVNRPPFVIPVAPGLISEGQAWTLSLGASDPDFPANALAFRLVSGPSGSLLDSKTGVLKWTPSEADGGQGIEWVVEVTDDGQPRLAYLATLRLTVLEVNEPPSLDPLADVTLKVGQPWTMMLRGSDNDLPVQTLTYALKTAPAGMTLDGQSKELRWVPSEVQSPGIFPVTVTLTDSGGAVIERSFVVKVAEVDQPPLMKMGLLIADGSFSLEIRASEGATVIVETSGDLLTWVEDQSVTGKGFSNPVLLTLQAHPEVPAKFWRARLKIGDPKPVGPAGFVWIPPGTFTMGSPTTEADRYVDEVQHMVTLTQGFWLSDHEVTQGEFEAVMGSNPSWHKGDSNRPVEKVTWESAVLYSQKLTERDRAAGRITSQQSYRLPTEAEWEYAARAGTTGARYGNLDESGWHSGNSGLGPHPVKQKSPNAWGLYDMIGNVWEWCSDRWDDYPTGSAIDPSGPITGTSHVFRGGSWGNGARFSRSASRWGSDSCFLCLRNDLGFRPAFGQIR